MFGTGSSPANVDAWEPTTRSYTRHLHYYLVSPAATTFDGLLAGGNGDCTSWAQLLSQCLLANNVPDPTRVRGKNPVYGANYGLGAAVITCQGNEDGTDPTGREYWSSLKLDDTSVDLPGQNTAPPDAKIFNWHEIVRVNAHYYDPSYGYDFANTSAAIGSYTTTGVSIWETPYPVWHQPTARLYTSWAKVLTGDELVFTDAP